MTTSILISKPPKQVANILNGKQSIIISKTVPKEWKDYRSEKTEIRPEPMTAYIYCTKGKPYFAYVDGKLYTQGVTTGRGPADICFNGKVVAKFTISAVTRMCLEQPYLDHYAKKACVSADDIINYQMHPIASKLYVLHISDLVIFDKPKEISEFRYWACLDKVKRAPQSWCYVEMSNE